MNQPSHSESLRPALPVVLPSAWSSNPISSQVTGSSERSTGTNTTPSLTLSPPPGRRRQVGSRQLARLSGSISDRDRRVVELVAAHRYLTTRQIEAFCFTGHASPASAARTARRILRRLRDHGLLHPLERRIGGVRAGSASYIWQLGTVGYRLLQQEGHLRRTHEPSPRFLDHCLAVADAHLQVVGTERHGAVESVSVECEPDCWRAYTGPGGERRLLQPDLFLVTRQQQYADRWFVEVDLGTESLKTMLGKCAQYEAYRASGVEQSSAGVFPLVIWQLPTKDRLDKLAGAIARSSRLLPELFRLVLPEGLGPLLAGGAT